MSLTGKTIGELEYLQFPTNETLIHDLYFTEYAWPLRGARFAERFGNNTTLLNIEIRFPFINYLALGFNGWIKPDTDNMTMDISFKSLESLILH